MKDGNPDRGAVPPDRLEELTSSRRYRRILVTAVLSVTAVAVVPLLILAGVTFYQYRRALRDEVTRPMVRFVANGRQSLESFLSERLSALEFVLAERSFDELRDPDTLAAILAHMRGTFGGFVDLGVLEDDGTQVAYAGPVDLAGKVYTEHPWFRQVLRRGSYVSDVYLGYRDVPHFVLAIRREPGREGPGFVIRSSIDADQVHRVVRTLVVSPLDDAFLVNGEGVLQTPSRFHGQMLGPSGLPPLSAGPEPELRELPCGEGHRHFVSYAQVEGSPFTLVLVSSPSLLEGAGGSLHRNLLVFLGVSVFLIVAVVYGGSRWMVNRAREADLQRAAAFHQVEYTNKMAALGRLSAGVAHEINNPLAIISEKAGLLKDLLLMSEVLPPKEKMVMLVDSVLRSAERCGGITHRLLGFAKHMEVQRETIDLVNLLEEVLGFLEKEAAYRGLRVVHDYPPEPPTVVADRGQLQQVFLNLINNAFAAVADGGRIEIGMAGGEGGAVDVWIADDGVGIPEDHLSRIFDPFFTTKKGSGTGLGLSITYGIIQKLGGRIAVRSTVGKGTRFTVTLPRGGTEA